MTKRIQQPYTPPPVRLGEPGSLSGCRCACRSRGCARRADAAPDCGASWCPGGHPSGSCRPDGRHRAWPPCGRTDPCAGVAPHSAGTRRGAVPCSWAEPSLHLPHGQAVPRDMDLEELHLRTGRAVRALLPAGNRNLNLLPHFSPPLGAWSVWVYAFLNYPTFLMCDGQVPPLTRGLHPNQKHFEKPTEKNSQNQVNFLCPKPKY